MDAFLQRTLKYNESHRRRKSLFVLQFPWGRLEEILIQTQGYNEPCLQKALPMFSVSDAYIVNKKKCRNVLETSHCDKLAKKKKIAHILA